MKTAVKIIVLLFWGLNSLFPQIKDTPLVSKGDLQFYLDFASFDGGDKIYQEYYVMIFADQLKLSDSEGSKTAKLDIAYEILDSENNIIETNNWITEAAFNDITDIRTLVIYDQWGVNYEAGKYKLSINISDRNSNLKGNVNSVISIPESNDGNVRISTIQFINGQAEKGGEFDTGTKSVVPNPSRRYGVFNPNLSFYYEISSRHLSNKSVFADYLISDSENRIVKKLEDVDLQLNKGTKGFTQAINISSLASGVYNFRIIVSDSSDDAIDETNRQFEIIQADYFSNIPYMTDDEVDLFGKILEYLTTPAQLNIYKNLNNSGKSYFLIRFFSDRDPISGTEDNEYLQSILARYHYSNQNFSWGNLEGWSTDRGRIFIQKGKPDEIELHSFETGYKPYQIWYYRTERELFYVFGDTNSNGNYILLHSNKEGEIYDTRWMEFVKEF